MNPHLGPARYCPHSAYVSLVLYTAHLTNTLHLARDLYYKGIRGGYEPAPGPSSILPAFHPCLSRPQHGTSHKHTTSRKRTETCIIKGFTVAMNSHLGPARYYPHSAYVTLMLYTAHLTNTLHLARDLYYKGIHGGYEPAPGPSSILPAFRLCFSRALHGTSHKHTTSRKRTETCIIKGFTVAMNPHLGPARYFPHSASVSLVPYTAPLTNSNRYNVCSAMYITAHSSS
ncbi:hypothetical protein J6590_091586 [Homalodisca vitripennis]|nr:hypothetical protein J6590_091586 [Homalodisca vitripennis]